MNNNKLLSAISDMLDEKLDKRFDEYDKKLDQRFAKYDKKLDQRFAEYDKKLNQKLDQRFAEYDKKLDQKLDQRFAEYDKKLDQKFDERLTPITDSLRRLELVQETQILPRLQNIESCYLSTYERYRDSVAEHEEMKQDITVLKKVVADHSRVLQQMA